MTDSLLNILKVGDKVRLRNGEVLSVSNISRTSLYPITSDCGTTHTEYGAFEWDKLGQLDIVEILGSDVTPPDNIHPSNPHIRVASQVADALRYAGYSEDQASFLFDRLSDSLRNASKKELFSLLILKEWK